MVRHMPAQHGGSDDNGIAQKTDPIRVFPKKKRSEQSRENNLGLIKY